MTTQTRTLLSDYADSIGEMRRMCREASTTELKAIEDIVADMAYEVCRESGCDYANGPEADMPHGRWKGHPNDPAAPMVTVRSCAVCGRLETEDGR